MANPPAAEKDFLSASFPCVKRSNVAQKGARKMKVHIGEAAGFQAIQTLMTLS